MYKQRLEVLPKLMANVLTLQELGHLPHQFLTVCKTPTPTQQAGPELQVIYVAPSPQKYIKWPKVFSKTHLINSPTAHKKACSTSQSTDPDADHQTAVSGRDFICCCAPYSVSNSQKVHHTHLPSPLTSSHSAALRNSCTQCPLQPHKDPSSFQERTLSALWIFLRPCIHLQQVYVSEIR